MKSRTAAIAAIAVLAEPPPRPLKAPRSRSKSRRGEDQSVRMARAQKSVRRRARAS